MLSHTLDVIVADLATIDIDETVLSVAELGHSLDIAMSEQLPEYLAAHTWLRNRLAAYLDFPASDIEFGLGEQGKPAIVAPATDLEFNLAYTDFTAVLAVAFRREVGVDVRVVSGSELEPGEIARTLSPTELQRYDESLNPMRTFQQFMARKEALSKAVGDGVPDDPRKLDVSGLSPVVVGDHVVTDLRLGDALVAAVASPPGLNLDLTVDTTSEGSELSLVAAAV